MCVYMFIYISNIYIYVLYVYIDMYVCMYVLSLSLSIYIYIYIYVYIHTYTYHMYIRLRVYCLNSDLVIRYTAARTGRPVRDGSDRPGEARPPLGGPRRGPSGGRRLQMRRRDLRSRRGFSVAFSHGISCPSGISQRIVTFPVDFYWKFPMDFSMNVICL